MTQHAEVAPGVGETATDQPTEFLDYVATQGLRSVALAAAELRIVAATHPLEFPGLAERAQSLQRMIAFMELGLRQAGYADEDINRIPSSAVRTTPPDPTKPRTNI